MGGFFFYEMLNILIYKKIVDIYMCDPNGVEYLYLSILL